MIPPTTTSKSISRKRGTNRPKLRRISSMVPASSRMKFCHIETSLPAVPQLDQSRFLSFERLRQFFDPAFHLFGRRVPVLSQERVNASPKQRNQGLHDVIAANHGLVICSREFINGPRPEFTRIRKSFLGQGRQTFELIMGLGAQNRQEHRVEFPYPELKHVKQTLAIQTRRFLADRRLATGARRMDWLWG